MLYEVGSNYNTTEATKNVCCGKSEAAVDPCTVTRWLRKFYYGCKKFDNQAGSDI